MQRHIWLIATLVLFCTSAFSATTIATQFVYPVGNRNYPPFVEPNSNGYSISQYFNTESTYFDGGARGGWCYTQSAVIYKSKSSCESVSGNKWMYGHTGNDLSNSQCGGTVRATAAGDDVFIGYQSTGYGNFIRIRHTLPNGRIIYSLYGHLQDFSIKVTDGSKVTVGQDIAKVGNTGMGASCHLHFTIYSQDMLMDPRLDIPVGYVYNDEGRTINGTTIYSNTMKYFYDSLLFVDDRNSRSSISMTCCIYLTGFTPTSSVLTKTMYAEDGSGQILSLQKAADAGWIYPYVYYKNSNGLWVYNTSWKIEEFVLRKNTPYAFLAKKSGVTLRYFKPGNNYLQARTRQDMMEYAGTKSGFSGLNRETFVVTPNWSPPYTFTQMNFDYWSNGWMNVWVEHIYDSTDPLVRRVRYRNMSTDTYSSWVSWY